MDKRLYIFIILLFSSTCALYSQDVIDEDSSSYWTRQLKTEVKLQKPVYIPYIGLGMGTVAFYGQASNKFFKEFTYGNSAVNFDVVRTIDSCFKFGFRYLYGTMSYSRFDLDPTKEYNFQTHFMTFGSSFQYNFANFKFIGKREKRVLTPYISLGFEFISAQVYTDRTDADGKPYYYWTDGSIRNMPESADPAHNKSTRLVRDYTYETPLANKTVFSIPAELGLEFTISSKTSFKLGYSYHYAFSNDLDGTASIGKGSKKNDAFSYSYIQFSLDLFSKTTEEKQLQFLDLGKSGIYDFWDMDGDYVMDLYDQCPWTPTGEKVDSVGCPLDDDKDGVPNYKDKEKLTPLNAFYVDVDGREVKEEKLLAKLNNNKSIEQAELYRHYPNLLEGTGLYRRFYMQIPPKFKSLDANNDEYISLDELLKAIDSFLESKSDLKVDDLYELVEFFFIQ